MKRIVILAALTLGACGTGGSPAPTKFGLGREATPAEIAARDIDAAPDGHGLPAGKGSVADGEALYTAKCASCHGPKGEGMPPAYPAIVGRDPKGEGFPFDKDPKIARTIGNYWPHATTVYDYVRRAMPHNAPGSLTSDETYALTAWLLSANGVIPATSVLDSATLVAVKMPYAAKFVPDDRKGGREVR